MFLTSIREHRLLGLPGKFVGMPRSTAPSAALCWVEVDSRRNGLLVTGEKLSLCSVDSLKQL